MVIIPIYLPGCIDFVPNCTSAGGFFTPSSYEPLSNVAAKANAYLRQNQHLSVMNVQTLDYKVSRCKSIQWTDLLPL